jgi:glycosyltransferase involved in cell wall biosynthesis
MTTNFRYEIVVVEETDNPWQTDGIKYIPHKVKNFGIAYARNLALSNAKGEIIVFIDDDCIIHDNWLDNLLEPLADNSVMGVQGGVTVPAFSNAIGWAESILGFPGGGIKRILEARGEKQKSREISTLNCAYRRRVFDVIGGFNEKLRYGGEDYLLAKHASGLGNCFFVPTAMVSHEARSNFFKIWLWFVRRGCADIQVIQTNQLANANLWSVLKRSLAVKLFSLVVLCFIFPGLMFLLIVVSLSGYLGLQYVRYFMVWKKSHASVAVILIIPIVKMIMDLAMDTGRIKRLVLG